MSVVVSKGDKQLVGNRYLSDLNILFFKSPSAPHANRVRYAPRMAFVPAEGASQFYKTHVNRSARFHERTLLHANGSLTACERVQRCPYYVSKMHANRTVPARVHACTRPLQKYSVIS